jgi:hypothetical protein
VCVNSDCEKMHGDYRIKYVLIITTRLQIVYVAVAGNLPLYYNSYVFYILLSTNL